MTREEFDHIGQNVIGDLRKAANCQPRNCRTELYHLPDGRAQLHHGARWYPRQPATHQGEIAIIATYTPEFGKGIVRSWRADHGMVDLLPDRHRLMGEYA